MQSPLATEHGHVAPSTIADAAELAEVLREEDRRELEDFGDVDAETSLRMGVIYGEPSLTLRTHAGEMIGILSCVRAGADSATIAFAGSRLIEEHRTAFLRGSREVLAEIDGYYSTLFNVCDARNVTHHRWLRWLGFSLINQIDAFGPNGVPAIEFARITHV